MTKRERQIITETIKEHQKTMLYYYEEGRKTGQWEDHEMAREALGAVRELGGIPGRYNPARFRLRHNRLNAAGEGGLKLLRIANIVPKRHL